jgi:hypothetical protein
MRGDLSGGAVMDILVWLRSLGLGKYEATFRENKVDETVLRSLTAEDLEELGVTAPGQGRKLLDAIAAVRADAGAKAPLADVVRASAQVYIEKAAPAHALSFRSRYQKSATAQN